jgi:hypothetical protein
MSRITAAEKRELEAVTNAIHAHFVRIEADEQLNQRIDFRGQPQVRLFNAQAWRYGRRVKVRYISYQGDSDLTMTEAQRYLAALDAGYTGRHHEHSLARFEAGDTSA